MRRSLLVLASVWVGAVAAPRPAPLLAQAPDVVAIRDAAAPRVCVVTVQNALGVPVAYATGFLFGEGRFAVTDLASLAQPGATQATLRFRDGRTAVARQFGMADPTIGLAAIRVEDDKTEASGLSFSGTPPADTLTEVVVVGWRWGQEFDVAVGKVANGISAPDLAARIKMEPPQADVTFLRYEGNRPDLPSGAPVFDRAGGVMGILVQVAGFEKSVVVPAALLRKALLAAEPKLRPLAELPKPIWPIAVVPFAVKPSTAVEFAQDVRAIKARSRCGKCSGKGTVMVEKIVGTRNMGGITTKIVSTVPETCRACKGEGVICNDGLYAQMVNMAEDGTWLAQAADVDARVKDAAITNGLGLLKGLSAVGGQYREGLLRQMQADLARTDKTWPRGLVVFACVRDSVDGPDGKYLLLAPHQSVSLLAAGAEKMASAADPKGGPVQPPIGSWIIVAGLALGEVQFQDQKATGIQPFVWTSGPSLGYAGHPGRHPGGPTPATPTPTPPTPKTPGAPDFFGL